MASELANSGKNAGDPDDWEQRRARLTILAELARRAIGCEAALIFLGDGQVITDAVRDDWTGADASLGDLADPVAAGDAGLALFIEIPLRGAEGHVGKIVTLGNAPQDVTTGQFDTLKLIAGLASAVVKGEGGSPRSHVRTSR